MMLLVFCNQLLASFGYNWATGKSTDIHINNVLVTADVEVLTLALLPSR